MTDKQQTSVDKVVASIERNGHTATVTTCADGAIKVQRDGAESYAIIGVRGGIRWR